MAARAVVSRGFLGIGGWERVTWSGVFAGLVMMIVTQVLLSVLGMAVGFTAIEPATETPGAGLGWGAAIWALVSLAISLFIGGYVAGRFAPTGTRANGAMNGALVWALSFILGIYLVGTGMRVLTNGLFGAVGGAAQASNATQSQIGRVMEQAGLDPNRVQQQAEQAAGRAADTARATGTTGTAENQQARQTADRAADYAATGLWMLLGGSVIGLVIAAWAGAMGHGRSLDSEDTRVTA
jgi:hypothetical protein